MSMIAIDYYSTIFLLVHATTRNQNDAVNFLKAKKWGKQPFYLTVAFFAPHAWDGNAEQVGTSG